MSTTVVTQRQQPQRSPTPESEDEDLDESWESVRDLMERSSRDTLQSIIYALLDSDKDAEMIALRYLAHGEEKRNSPTWSADAAYKSRITAIQSHGYNLVCKGCGQHFNKADNALGSCNFFRYHPREPVPAKFRYGRRSLAYTCCGEEVGGDKDMQAALDCSKDPIVASYLEQGCRGLRHIADPNIDLRKQDKRKSEANTEVNTGSKRRRVE